MGAIESGGSFWAYTLGLVIFGFGSYMIIDNLGNKMVDAVKGRVMNS